MVANTWHAVDTESFNGFVVPVVAARLSLSSDGVWTQLDKPKGNMWSGDGSAATLLRAVPNNRIDVVDGIGWFSGNDG